MLCMSSENTEYAKEVVAVEPIKDGDVVRLKSGGPKMTVVSVSAKGEVECSWFDKKGEPQRGLYRTHMLQKMTDQDPS